MEERSSASEVERKEGEIKVMRVLCKRNIEACRLSFSVTHVIVILLLFKNDLQKMRLSKYRRVVDLEIKSKCSPNPFPIKINNQLGNSHSAVQPSSKSMWKGSKERCKMKPPSLLTVNFPSATKAAMFLLVRTHSTM